MESSIITILGKALVFSMMVERIITVIRVIFNIAPAGPDSAHDWGRIDTLFGSILAAIISYVYGFDLFAIITSILIDTNGHPVVPNPKIFGFIVTGIFVGGGSAGIRLIVDNLRLYFSNVKIQSEIQRRIVVQTLKQTPP